VIPAASGVALCLKDCSGIGLLATATSTAATSLAFTAATSFGGTYNNVTPANGFGQPNTWYQRTAPTAAWAAQAAAWTTNSLAIGGTINYVSYVDFLVSELADQYDYLKVTATNAGLTAILYDLTVMRTPANLRIPSA
jgi:hypothetical protein